ncbi:MAG: ATP synthase F1 subunit gamma [Desulfuromonadales bacterium]|nr:ATP synthase F1 subunit gamma [Desulfuromonadales bacterium]
MPNLKSIKKRIGSVKNTGQITKAMKMVSAAKLRKAQDNVVAARPYAEKLSEVLYRLADSVEPGISPLLGKRERNSDRVLLVVVTSDRGLCGGFNAYICKTADKFLKENKNKYSEIKIMTIGRKGYDFLKNRYEVWKSYSNIQSNLNYDTAAALGQEIISGYIDEHYDEVHILYNEFKSVMSQVVTLTQMLPIIPETVSEEDTVVAHTEYIYEPGQAALVSELLPKHIEVQIFRILLESVAGEHGARMTAMDSASKNATEMIGRLTLAYNRARQAAITTELMEIISGAESIKG